MLKLWRRLILLLVVVFVQGCCWSNCPPGNKQLQGNLSRKGIVPIIQIGLDHGIGHPRLPLDHATALQHLRQEACMDSTVTLRGHKGPRRSARPVALPLGLRMARSDGRIQALGRLHIGGVAYLCTGASAYRLHRHVEYPTVADAVIESYRSMCQVSSAFL